MIIQREGRHTRKLLFMSYIDVIIFSPINLKKNQQFNKLFETNLIYMYTGTFHTCTYISPNDAVLHRPVNQIFAGSRIHKYIFYCCYIYINLTASYLTVPIVKTSIPVVFFLPIIATFTAAHSVIEPYQGFCTRYRTVKPGVVSPQIPVPPFVHLAQHPQIFYVYRKNNSKLLYSSYLLMHLL